MADVITFARDMLFTSKIREVARQLGVSVAAARDPARLPAEAAAAGARLVILDLRLPEAMDALAALAAAPAGAQLRTVGFVDHEKVEVMDAARARGCGEVLTKGQFAHSLPRLLAPLAPEPAR
jgi:DNA-binding NarL/FixJ family response regulator